jgi:hypothetical protein
VPETDTDSAALVFPERHLVVPGLLRSFKTFNQADPTKPSMSGV